MTASETPTIRERAWSRVHQKLRPAGRGKQNMKDCMVVETVLEVMEAARRLGFQGRATFLSSNTEDFGKTRGGRPHPDLEMSFDAVHLNYAVTFHHARFLLDL